MATENKRLWKTKEKRKAWWEKTEGRLLKWIAMCKHPKVYWPHNVLSSQGIAQYRFVRCHLCLPITQNGAFTHQLWQYGNFTQHKRVWRSLRSYCIFTVKLLMDFTNHSSFLILLMIFSSVFWVNIKMQKISEIIHNQR